MKKLLLIGLFIINTIISFGEKRDSLLFQGQISAWVNYNPEIEAQLQSGTRYIPQLNYSLNLNSPEQKVDFEASANIFGDMQLYPFDKNNINGKIKPYRAWARYSSDRIELRIGLQKINFGSSTLLRPLMWFDKLDPRDPLQLTDGVWGLLGRYYFQNNANLWLWGLYGNDEAKTWEIAPTSKHVPEFGGRYQQPTPKGEAAISFHHRMADTRDLNPQISEYSKLSENRVGIDGKWDLGVGLWVEGSWIFKSRDIGAYTNQEILNAGMDYTFGLGNGLNLICEQLVFSYDEKPFGFNNTLNFSAVSASYPVSMFDQVNGIMYYDWKNDALYNFISWKKQFNKTSLYLMFYSNPVNYQIPLQSSATNIFGGTGVQVMFVYNH
jgi:hypothetical protein